MSLSVSAAGGADLRVVRIRGAVASVDGCPVRRLSGHRGERQREHGGILLLALVLSTTFGLLALAVLASADLALRVQQSSGEAERARRAAASGIEWAAAVAMATDTFAVKRTVALTAGVSVTIVADSSNTPQLLATATCEGVAVTLGANVRRKSGPPLPYAFASFGGQAVCGADAKFKDGPLYFAEPTGPITADSRGKIDVSKGDAYLVSSKPLTAAQLKVDSGQVIHYGVTPIGRPTVDTTPYVTMTGGAVPVTRYAGNTTLYRQTITGIVVVELAPLQTLTIEDSKIFGTVVVRSVGGDAIGSGTVPGVKLTAPVVRLRGSAKITGGTATTGNLALLAPGCLLVADVSGGNDLLGVTFVWACSTLKGTKFVGQLVTTTTWDSAESFDVERPSGFVAATPIGISWPGSSSLRIEWLGAQ